MSVAGLRVEVDDAGLVASLRKFAATVEDRQRLLLDFVPVLEDVARTSFDRAQKIPLAPSTVKRKKYPRRSAGKQSANVAKRSARLAELTAEGRGNSRQARGIASAIASGNATKKPKSNARTLERVGGFIESLTEPSAPFSVRTINAREGTLRFGTKLGGLLRIFLGNGRLDFLVSDLSALEAERGIREKQVEFVEHAMESAR